MTLAVNQNQLPGKILGVLLDSIFSSVENPSVLSSIHALTTFTDR
jgi:hypothetical protein